MNRSRSTPFRRTSLARRPSKGFTLIELMVVIVILGLLLGVVVPNVFNALGGATKDTARAQMKGIADAIEMYRLNNRALPKSLDELTQPDTKSGEPYIKQIPLDPWKEQYEYKVVNSKTKEFTITSAGEDRQWGTDDDIVYPEPNEQK
jgi:general secretion pathway protein G